MDAKKPRCQPRALLVGGVLSTGEITKASSGQASRRMRRFDTHPMVDCIPGEVSSKIEFCSAAQPARAKLAALTIGLSSRGSIGDLQGEFDCGSLAVSQVESERDIGFKHI